MKGKRRIIVLSRRSENIILGFKNIISVCLFSIQKNGIIREEEMVKYSNTCFIVRTSMIENCIDSIAVVAKLFPILSKLMFISFK